VRLGENQLAHVYRAHVRAFATLDMEPVPELYITQFPIANASTIGSAQPIVVVNSELIQLLDVEQLRAVFAHEAAHVLSDHVLYHTALGPDAPVDPAGDPVPLSPAHALMSGFGPRSQLHQAALVTGDRWRCAAR
jgi:hypothetical protein